MHSLAFLDREMTQDDLVKAATHTDTDLSLPKGLVEICLSFTPPLGPEGRHELIFSAPSNKGSYSFLCPMPGHPFLGMHGVLIVE